MKKGIFLIFIFSIVFFSLSFTPSAFAQTSNGGALSLQVSIFTDGNTYIQGSATVDPLLPVKYSNGTISGVTSKLTSKQGEEWRFTLKTQNRFNEFNARFVLPANAKLITESVKSGSIPLVYTQGKSLVIEVSGLQQPLDITFGYVLADGQNDSASFPVVWIYIIAILIAAAIVFFILRKKRTQGGQQKKVKKKAGGAGQRAGSTGLRAQSGEHGAGGTGRVKETKEPLTDFRKKFNTLKQTLNEREIKTVEGLMDLGGKAKQNQLQKFTAIPKAAFSRHISSLEAKGLISKKSLGRVNLIQVKAE